MDMEFTTKSVVQPGKKPAKRKGKKAAKKKGKERQGELQATTPGTHRGE
jgi:hypothetical protein